MKNRFSTLDLIAIITELSQKLVGMRVNQVYDVDSKTFLIRFAKTNNNETIEEETLKQMLLLESGIRMHLTEFDWPKSSNPSGFTMKLRKHLRNKRLESITQLGVDRIVDLQFGINEFTNHVIIEFFSKGNIILTDKDYNILSLIRFYKDAKTNVNIAVREKYPMIKKSSSQTDSHYIADESKMTREKILAILKTTKDTAFKKVFNPHFLYGPALLEHSLLNNVEAVDPNKFKVSADNIDLLVKVFEFSEKQVDMFKKSVSSGFIVKKRQKHVNSEQFFETFDEFHPYKFAQFDKCEAIEQCETFNKAVDVFFSSIEGQRIESKVVQQEKQAMMKLDAIKRDQQSRVDNLIVLQKIDHKKAEYIEKNVELVDKALSVIRSAIANKYSWEMIQEIVSDAQDSGDLIALKIKELKFDKNRFSMLLADPYDQETEGMLVDIDIGLSAHANARKYYGNKKDAAKKEQKTIDNAEKIFKNVERKVKQQLKETTIKTNIVLSRKILWFEKFYWCISSEGFLIIAGHDMQQNELIVKRYLNKDDIYVHADIHGATSLVIKNHTNEPVPPKTLNEAACMAVCYSASWEAKVVSAAYWVYSHQVQKTAPTGQYLSVGSFMIRGKKNYLPIQNLILGFGFLFRIDDESIEKRAQLAKIKEAEYKQQEQGDQVVEFPDTSININPLLAKVEETEANDPEDYTIVTTGEQVRKKVKVITQKIVAKNIKANKRAKKKARNANSNSKAQEEDEPEEDVIVEQQAKDDTPQDEDKDEEKENNEVDEEEPEKAEEDDEDKDAANEIDEANEEEEEEEEEADVKKDLDSKKILDSLVSSPIASDYLLYAIPVCGPYASMQQYKYKVKIIPGTARRGKASKMALHNFLKEKSATEREKDLLKAIKDQDIGKNMPAKIKIVAGHSNK